MKQIGGPNCNLWTNLIDGTQLMVECGIRVVADNTSEIPPNAYPSFVGVDLDRLAGLVLTHAHIDHIGGLPKLLSTRKLCKTTPFDVWATAETILVCKKVLVREKLSPQEIDQSVNFHILQDEQTIGSFKVYAYPVIHSIPGTVAFVIETSDGKTFCHVSDFKYSRANTMEFTQTSQMFRAIGEQNMVDAILLDSSNVYTEGFTPSNHASLYEFGRIFSDPELKDIEIIIAMFGSDAETVADLAMIANQIGNRPVECVGDNMCFFSETFGAIDPMQQHTFPNAKVFIATGSQGEPRAAVTRAANGNNPPLEIKPGSIVIFATRAIPGNREALWAVIRKLRAMGVRVIVSDPEMLDSRLMTKLKIEEHEIPEVNSALHVSGHESLAGLLQVVSEIATPGVTKVIPIHGGRGPRKQLAARISKQFDHKIEVALLVDGERITF